MLKLIHMADLHLDSAFFGLSPQRAAQRRQEQRQVLLRLADLAREKEADLVLLAGDLLDNRRIFRETAHSLPEALGAIPCPVFIAPGNHDYYHPTSPYVTLSWPDNVHIFSSAQMESIPLPKLGCTVHGRAFTAPQQTDSPLAGFRAEGPGLHVAVIHGDTEGASPHGPISPEDIAASGLSYLALGHIHKGSGLQKTGNTPWAYPGCPEGRGFDELGDKGVLYLERDESGCRAEFIPLAKRRYQILPVDVTGAADPEQAILLALPGGTEEDIYRIILTGERPEQAPDLRQLEQRLAPRFYGLTLSDQTHPAQRLWARAGEDTLTGLFLREMQARCGAQPEDEVLSLAVQFGLAALENGGDVSP